MAAVVGMIALALSLGAVGGALAAGNTVKAKLTGKAEVPGPGDDDGSGDAELKLKKKKKKVCFNISFAGIENPTDGHIHKGGKKVAGDIVVTLFHNDAGASSPLSDCVDARRKLIKKIKNNPNAYYVNLHTDDFPDGAIRGQLKPGASGGGGSNGGGGSLY